MGMAYDQVMSILNNNGGIDNLALLINDAGSTINLINSDKSLIEINAELNYVRYPIWDNNQDMMLMTYLSLDSLADIRMRIPKDGISPPTEPDMPMIPLEPSAPVVPPTVEPEEPPTVEPEEPEPPVVDPPIVDISSTNNVKVKKGRCKQEKK